jgi:exonuclease SbcD
MRFIHTADWHLGRIFHGVHLTEDQAYVLNQFVDLVRERKPDAVLISGDVYDRAVPPPEAVALLDDVLSRIVLDLKVKVILIAGNHDSPDRLGFGSRLLAGQGLHVIGSLTAEPFGITLQDEYGPVEVFALPYAEPSIVRERLGDESIIDHNSAMSALVKRALKVHHRRARSVLLAHAFVAGSEESESERPLSIGGTSAVDRPVFEDFQYVALGHLHRPQQAGNELIRYSGSLLKYSFSESGHDKSVNIVDLDAPGECRVEKISLSPRRDVRCVEGLLDDILQRARDDKNGDDYLMVTLLDKGPILNVMGKLREVYPNVLDLERPVLMASGQIGSGSIDHRKMQDIELFSSFFSQVTSEDLTEEQSMAYTKSVDALHQQERESLP